MIFQEKNKKIILSISLFIILGGTVLFFGFNYLFKKELGNPLENQVVSQDNSQREVLYIINKGEGKVSQYRTIPKENSTVFSLLVEIGEREDFEVESTIYEGMGVFVETIDGIENGIDNKYWQYWVNDSLGEVAADKKIIKPGEKVEWKFDVPIEF